MAVRLTGTDTDGVFPDANSDWWLTLAGELVANNAIAFNIGIYTNITYSIQGTVVSSSSTAINSNHSAGVGASAKILIGETGVVQSGSYAVFLRGDHNLIRNEGSVTSAGAPNIDALRIDGDDAQITNLGTMQASGSTMQILGDNAVVINHGTASGDYNALYLAGTSGRLDNYGMMQGNVSGVFLGGAGNTVFNAGTISATDNAIRVSSGGGEGTTIRNIGTIQNTSERTATILGTNNGAEMIENEGLILGHIDLFGQNDSYLSMAGHLTGTLDMGSGNDVVTLGDGALATVFDLIGGDDSDTLDLSHFGHAIWADLTHANTQIWTRDGNDLLPSAGDWRRIVDLDGVENLVGTVGIDLMRGDAQDNTFGYVGTSFIAGTETIDGRGGVDMVDFSRADFAVWVDLNAGAGTEAYTQDDDNATDAPTGSSPWRRIADLTGIENLTGTDRVDQMAGTNGDNLFVYRGLKAFAGTEIIDGRGGSDTLDLSAFASAAWVNLGVATEEVWTQDDIDATDGGGNWRILADLSGVENIIGTARNDLITGDAGANVIEGGAGRDDLRGMGGDDTFVFKDGFGRDTIFDFSASNAEKIDLSGVAEITDFVDLVSNHLVNTGGMATISVDLDNRIVLQGWTVADVGAGLAISADDFIF